MTNSIAYNIKKIREAKNLTQEYLAARLGISQNAYSRIENDRTKLSTDRLRQIAHVFNVSAHELLISAESKPPTPESTHNDYMFNLVEIQKENYKQTIALLKEEVEHLRKENIKLVELLDSKIGK
jgi:transcriptional regulator with XRE-family HTH domain